MCGIAGFVIPVVDIDHRSALHDMAAAVAHRGPDDEGFHEAVTRDGRHLVGLAHRRLAIIDLQAGHQPMSNEDRELQLVFNGEIYNFRALRAQLMSRGHRFRTDSDTETIIHSYEEWSERCVDHFRGMFAFAMWDARRERLFLARDCFGKKPLYVCEQDGMLLFASEVKSILAFPTVKTGVDIEAVWDYFAYRYVPAPATLFKGIRKLMPGSCAVWENGRMQESRYYFPPDRGPRRNAGVPPDPVGAFLATLDEAVRIRMMSDVPFGAFLSGGIDSSAVVGLMARHSEQPVKTFSVGFTDAGYSELNYARAVAARFGTEHHELTVSESEFMAYLPQLVRFRDAPVSEPSDVPLYLLSLQARKSVKMVLTGEGADEFLGGYPKHVYEHFARWYQNMPALLRSGLVNPLIQSLPYRFRRAKTAIASLDLPSFEERMPRWFGALSDHERAALIALTPPARRRARFDGMPFDSDACSSPLRRMLYFDQVSWLPDNLLERGDRMTMAASLEARMPFVDRELAALVSSLPDSYRVRGRATKWILHQAMKQMLPRAVLHRRKVGFRVAVNDWFRGATRNYLYDLLTGPGSATVHYYYKPALAKILDDHGARRHNHEKLLWTLLNLELWHREYAI